MASRWTALWALVTTSVTDDGKAEFVQVNRNLISATVRVASVANSGVTYHLT
ncbi:hypothetical protein [Mycobacterium leprae]|uniref:hypothetical protein n=1 Tax=Mycobacterium leprae TaxID=1769 RepID=UPI0002FD02A2|nr:hypothetical protein [Mycobacterium leprae]